MKRVSLTGVIIGSIIDIVSTNIAVLPVMIYILISSGRPLDTPESFSQVLAESGIFRGASIILGASCSVLAGYLAARIAKHDEVLNGALSSILCIAIALYSVLSGGPALHLAFLLVSPVLGGIGGYIYSRRKS